MLGAAAEIISWKPVNGIITISDMKRMAVAPDMPDVSPTGQLIHG